LVEYTTRKFSGENRHDSGVEAYLEIAKLRELLAAVIETTEVGLGLIMDDLVGAYIPTLGESLPADFAMIWSFSSMASFVCLEFFVSHVGCWEVCLLHLPSDFQVERNCDHILALYMAVTAC
jgi:hypothetical protein